MLKARVKIGRVFSSGDHMAFIKHILFPVDFSSQTTEAAPFVVALARAFGARVTMYTVVPPTWELPPEVMQGLVGRTPAEWTQTLKDRLERTLVQEFAGVTTDRIADAGDPAVRIAAVAESSGVDLVMLPTHGVGPFRRFLAGSVTSKVLHDAHRPVWTATHAETQASATLPRRILCAVDGGETTPTVLSWAAKFSAELGADLTVLHVAGVITDWPALDTEHALQETVRQQARERLTPMVRAAGITSPVFVAVGEIVVTVSEEARRENADLVVIGRGAIASTFGRLRTHAFGIVQRAPCPVLSV
jgi:nucleotide-binding universal stress UspA family protein